MGQSLVIPRTVERRSEPRREVNQYYSVEFSIDGMDLPYQFKIWNIASKSMCVLIKEGSDILSHLRVGEKINMKYYLENSTHPTEYRETAIRHITKDENGKFKGHYLVGLEIMEAALNDNRPS